MAAQFYADVFGWGVDGDDRWAAFALRGQRVASARRVETAADYWVPCIAVNGVAAIAEAAAAAGGTIVDRASPAADDTSLAVVQDPEGAVFGLCAPTSRYLFDVTEGPGACGGSRL